MVRGELMSFAARSTVIAITLFVSALGVVAVSEYIYVIAAKSGLF